jgi:hypothetical protein
MDQYLLLGQSQVLSEILVLLGLEMLSFEIKKKCGNTFSNSCSGVKDPTPQARESRIQSPRNRS